MPAGEADAFGACERLVAVWQCHNKIISHGIPGCLPDFFLSGIFPAKADIFFNGSVKQISVLLHIGDLRPQIGQLQASDVFSVYVNIAGIRFIETGDQAAERGFAHEMCIRDRGKTFTMANIIARMNKPTLVLAHNKTLAAQLYSEFKEFFPNNAVEYFVSYYDYYQPEAYVPSTDTYIEKDSSINDEIDKMRHSATAALAERQDVIIISSVSCICLLYTSRCV